ncbi:MAG: hypothetical protein JHC71_03400 [Blastococcus sp.]|nr:hypothetical protein [Blastococcus sp.]
MPSRPRPSRRRRTFLVVLLAVAIAVGAGFWLTTRADDGTTAAGDVDPVAAPTTEAPDEGGEPVTTLEPERTGGVPQPTAPSSEVATDTPAPTEEAGAEVAPQLTYYGWDPAAGAVEAGGIVMGLVESGGTCTLTLTKGSTAVDVSADAVDNVTSTSCPAMTVPGDRLESGTWQATLSYESRTSQGTGDAVEIQVP